jgi:hypothetical protein
MRSTILYHSWRKPLLIHNKFAGGISGNMETQHAGTNRFGDITINLFRLCMGGR